MNYFFRVRFFCAMASLSLFLINHTAAAAETATNAPNLECVLASIERKVEVATRGTIAWRPARTNEVLAPGDRLRTGLRSRATLRWSELSVVRVNELTTIEIEPPTRRDQKPKLDLKSGAAYFFSRERPADIEFRTPVASGAIRGTEFHLAVSENGRTELTLLNGEVRLENAQGALELRSGEQALVEPGQAPKKTAFISAQNIIQWVLYYPAVVDPDEIGLSDGEKETLAASLKAHRSGDLLEALNGYPETRTPGSDAERILRAALLLGAGQVEHTVSELKSVPVGAPPAEALREVIAAVKNEDRGTVPAPTTGSQWLARSYYLQSQSRLDEALKAAREAAGKSPRFGAAWVRVAELEFAFGRTAAALEALERGLELSPRNAQGQALKGFLLAAKNRPKQALQQFDEAIAIDGALANAWLGRGLVKIQSGRGSEGLRDLQVAATVEPQRALPRAYLGKAFSHTRDPARAEKELQLAKDLDPNDPTAWLYSALLKEQQNRINEAVEDLETSKELNQNRSVFRSRLLLDHDQSVRSANLAAIYRDAGLIDHSVQEAARAVNYDYGNYSAHLFLASSYDALRDPRLINLRYETPWFSELLVANLLAPASGGTLSPTISQQEYSRFFAGQRFGVFSSTEYLSSGDWLQSGSQYGIFGNSSYSLDAYYRTEQGQRPNNDSEQLSLSGAFKQQLTAQDSVFVQVGYVDLESGDVAQYYNQDGTLAGVPAPSRTLRVSEKQEPNVLLGYHREWAPGSHTLFLAGRFDDTLTLNDESARPLYLERFVFLDIGGALTTNVSLSAIPAELDYRSELEAYSAELQHIWQTHLHTLIVGARYQTASVEADSELARASTTVLTTADSDLDRVSVYAYEHWQVLEQLRLMAGISYDRLEYPENVDTSPISQEETSEDQISPKAGLLWTPCKDTHVRAAYTRSLGGVYFDTSIRLEPTQIGGFNQAFRSLIPESVVGLVPGTEFETWGVGVNHALKTGTYVDVAGEWLKSDASRTVGMLTNSDPFLPVVDRASSVSQLLDYEEKSLVVSVNQLLGKSCSVGARYRLTHAELEQRFVDLPTAVSSSDNEDVTAILHQAHLYAMYYHRLGFFGQVNSIWTQQSNQGYTPDLPGDDFWQFNVYAGYRFWQRRAEARVGLLNLTDQDYRLNPLTLYNELPRERTLALRLDWHF